MKGGKRIGEGGRGIKVAPSPQLTKEKPISKNLYLIRLKRDLSIKDIKQH